MDDQTLLLVFRSQLFIQCDYVNRATSALRDSLIKDDAPGVFFSLQNLLVSAANIGKLLWGSGVTNASQRLRLREQLNIPENSILHEMKMRNHYEHFDERIERWAKQSVSGHFLDHNVMSIMGVDEPVIDWFRVYDPHREILSFWGDTFDLGKLLEAVADLEAQLETTPPNN